MARIPIDCRRVLDGTGTWGRGRWLGGLVLAFVCAGTLGLGGCYVVPAGYPVAGPAYVAPAPVMVVPAPVYVVPGYGYGYGHGYGYGGGWRRYGRW